LSRNVARKTAFFPRLSAALPHCLCKSIQLQDVEQTKKTAGKTPFDTPQSADILKKDGWPFVRFLSSFCPDSPRFCPVSVRHSAGFVRPGEFFPVFDERIDACQKIPFLSVTPRWSPAFSLTVSDINRIVNDYSQQRYVVTDETRTEHGKERPVCVKSPPISFLSVFHPCSIRG